VVDRSPPVETQAKGRQMLDGHYIRQTTSEEVWIQDGVYHRLNGPAIVAKNGTKHWYQNGVLHREDGHASEWTEYKLKCYYLNGNHYPGIKNDLQWRIEVQKWKRNQKKVDKCLN